MSDTDTQIVFAQFQQPGLRDDTYTITAQLVLTTTDPTAPTFAAIEQVIQVGTSAESIPSDSLVTEFPPDGESGHYTGHLPHVLLSHATLPWHKSMGKRLSTPWLALLVVTDEELRSADVTVAKDPKTITFTSAFFQSIAPTLDELDYLAHVRRVDTHNKVDASDVITTYSLVVGNRLPVASTGSNVFLVPLHDHVGFLPGGASVSPGDVTLPVLYSWRFFTQPDERTFGAVVSAVDRAPATLRVPDDGPNNLMAMGYLPMPHALRVGGQTVSWYRGPFTPYPSNRQLPKVPVQTADAVTFYDPGLGMMDVSCSSAWMLGRLMALNAGSFAAALYKWKRGLQRTTLDKIIYQWDTGQTLPGAAAAGISRRAMAEQALSSFLPKALASLGGHAPVRHAPEAMAVLRPARPVRARNQRPDLRAAMTDVAGIRAIHGVSPRPHAMARVAVSAAVAEADTVDPAVDPNVTQIWSWLGDLMLFKGVPLFYLVPDERMLPTESIRFFHVDQSWLTALLDGALSLGRVTAADLSHDDAFHPSLHAGAAKAAAAARPRRRGALASTAGDFPLVPARPVSGLYLRSSAVTYWPGLQIAASGPQGDATILRMDSVGTLLICLFDRPVDQVKLSAPPEGVHFGFEEVEANGTISLMKKRRLISGSDIGTETDQNPLTSVPYRAGGASGVLDVHGLAKTFADSFGMPLNSDDPSGKQPFTAAEFALQMVDGVDEVVFKLTA